MEAGPDNIQVHTEPESSALVLLAEGVVLLLSLLRIFVVALVLAVNIIALRRSSSKRSKCHCLYLYVSDSVKICSIIYITSWIPFLLYSLLNGRWLLIDQRIFCLIQNYMTNAVLLVLLAMAALITLTKLPSVRHMSPKLAAGLTLTAWIVPQFTYFVILTCVDNASGAHRDQDFYLLDDLFGTKGSHRSTEITYSVGFTICGHSLCPLGLSRYTLQYLIIILPMCFTTGFVYLRYQSGQRSPLALQSSYSEEFNREKLMTDEIDGVPACHCSQTTTKALEIVLFCIAVWLVLIRPVILFAWSPKHLFDLGSHILLSITAVFAPIFPQQKTTRKVSVFRIDPASVTSINTSVKEYTKLKGRI